MTIKWDRKMETQRTMVHSLHTYRKLLSIFSTQLAACIMVKLHTRERKKRFRSHIHQTSTKEVPELVKPAIFPLGLCKEFYGMQGRIKQININWSDLSNINLQWLHTSCPLILLTGQAKRIQHCLKQWRLSPVQYGLKNANSFMMLKGDLLVFN